MDKKSHNAEKKLKGGTLLDFSTSILSQNIKKNAGRTLWGKILFFEKKSLAVPKKMNLVSPGMVCYAEKQEKPFWFSSLDQIVHFDAIIFCRTFVELFWSVRVDRKTSRDRHKSAPYPMLKNSKKTSKCQVLYYSTRKSKFFEKKIFEKITYSKKWTEWRAGAR